MRPMQPAISLASAVLARQPFRTLKGLASAYLAFSVAERLERRHVLTKLAEMRAHGRLAPAERRRVTLDRLAATVAFAAEIVPYYRDVFSRRPPDPDKIRGDPRYLEELPFLTKDIIREQAPRLLSRPLTGIHVHACQTGGSTGPSCTVYYDDEAADYSAALTLFARETIGKRRDMPETHLAARFADVELGPFPSREDFKCFAMNRTNLLFDRLDAAGLEQMWRTLLRHRPVLLHGHPSTLDALATHVERVHGGGKAFEVFESSGESLDPAQRHRIERALNCRVVNRYGLAEIGIVAYEKRGVEGELDVFDALAWPETRPVADAPGTELVLTGLRNSLMPLIRYATGDLAGLEMQDHGPVLTGLIGRIHDMVPINGVPYPSHHIQDVLEHRIGGVEEFQIDLGATPPVLRIVTAPGANPQTIHRKLDAYWPGAFAIEFVAHGSLRRVGHLAKFRHVVNA